MATTTTTIGTFMVGDHIVIDHTITELTAPISSAELGLKASRGSTTNVVTRTITTSATAYGQIISAGTLQGDGSYTAEVAFILTSADTQTYLTPGFTTWGYIRCVYASGDGNTPEVLAITPDVGGKFG